MGTGGAWGQLEGDTKARPPLTAAWSLISLPLCLGSSFSAYVTPTTSQHIFVQGHSSGHAWGLLEMSGDWTVEGAASGGPGCIGERE